MTIKEAVLVALAGANQPMGYDEVTQYIVKNHLYESRGLTLDASVSAQLGEFIRKNDTRIGRIKHTRQKFYLMLAILLR